MTNLYCVIVTYNAMKWVDRCFSSLQRSVVPVNVVVVDNGSNDGTITYLCEKYPEVHFIVNDVNKGFGQANNQGIEYAYRAGATHVFLLNQDAWIECDTLNSLLKVQDKYNFDVVSPIHLNGTGDRLDFGFYEAAVEQIHNISFVSDLYINDTSEYYIANNINAAAWLLTRETISQIGGFDPLFFHYGEDGNYSQRLKYHNKTMAFVPQARIYHDRKQYGNISIYKKNELVNTLLLLYSDINTPLISFNRKRIKTHLNNFARLLNNLVHLNITVVFNMLSDSFRFIFKYPDIVESRRKNRQIGTNWLKI